MAHDLLINKSSRKKFPTANQSTRACQERQFIKFIKIVVLHYILYDHTYFRAIHSHKSSDRFFKYINLIMLKKIIYQRCTLNVARRKITWSNYLFAWVYSIWKVNVWEKKWTPMSKNKFTGIRVNTHFVIDVLRQKLGHS